MAVPGRVRTTTNTTSLYSVVDAGNAGTDVSGNVRADDNNSYDMAVPGRVRTRSRSCTIVSQNNIIYAVPGLEEAVEEGDVIYSPDAAVDAVEAHSVNTAGAKTNAPVNVTVASMYSTPMKVRARGKACALSMVCVCVCVRMHVIQRLASRFAWGFPFWHRYPKFPLN